MKYGRSESEGWGMGNQSEEKKEGERSSERMECPEAEFLNF